MTTSFLSQWREARTRYSALLQNLNNEDTTKRIGHVPNSAGFLIRHIAEVELLFAKNVFGVDDLHFTARTVIDQKDTGEWTNPEDLLSFEKYAFVQLELAILQQTDEDWEQLITTPQFGTRSKAEALGRIISHTAYHAGQLALVLKYGH